MNLFIFILIKGIERIKKVLRKINFGNNWVTNLILNTGFRPGRYLKTGNAAQSFLRIKRIAFQVLSDERFNLSPICKQARVFIRPAKQNELFTKFTAQVKAVGMGYVSIVAGSYV